MKNKFNRSYKDDDDILNIPTVSTKSSCPAATRSNILDPNNNCNVGDGFDAREIRSAFLRFMVSILKDQDQYTTTVTSTFDLLGNTKYAKFDVEGFLSNQPPESYTFLREMCLTQTSP